MSISKNCEAEVLRSLQREPKSTKALMADILELSCDRVQTSIFLRDMRARGLIEKISNGYWRIPKAETEPVEQVSETQTEAELETTNSYQSAHKLVEPEPAPAQETALIDEPAGKDFSGTVPPESKNYSIPIERGFPVPGQLMVAMSSDVIKGLMPEVHPKTSLVIEHDVAFIYFVGNKFRIDSIEDVRVCRRMAECHVDGPDV